MQIPLSHGRCWFPIPASLNSRCGFELFPAIPTINICFAAPTRASNVSGIEQAASLQTNKYLQSAFGVLLMLSIKFRYIFWMGAKRFWTTQWPVQTSQTSLLWACLGLCHGHLLSLWLPHEPWLSRLIREDVLCFCYRNRTTKRIQKGYSTWQRKARLGMAGGSAGSTTFFVNFCCCSCCSFFVNFFFLILRDCAKEFRPTHTLKLRLQIPNMRCTYVHT